MVNASLELTFLLNIPKLVVDNKTVAQVVRGATRIPWRIVHLIKDVQCWQDAGIQLPFKHIFREANWVADWAAKHGQTISHSLVADNCFSPELQTIIVDDVIGCSFKRKGT